MNNKTWGNTDFDVNLAVTNPATSQDGQMFFDIFDTDGFVGDILLRQRRLLSLLQRAAAALSLPHPQRLDGSLPQAGAHRQPRRHARGTKVPFHFIANDGNLVVKPIPLTELDEQGIGERYDIVVDFRTFAPGTASICSTS